MIVLTQDGEHAEMTANVTSTRLYQNLGSATRFMAFYDVKNAKLLERQGMRMRWEPGIDVARFERFLSMVESIAKPGEDFCWILAGSSESAAKRVVAALTKKGATWKFKQYFLVYDTKQLQKWYWTGMRGLANSRTTEKAYLCWKGACPKNMPKHRYYVDAGSGLYVNTMLRVPVLAPKDLTFVDRAVSETSMKVMGASPASTAVVETTGVDTCADDSMELEAASAAVEAEQPGSLVQHVKKRKLYRHATGEEVEWFPLDNSPDLLRELAWECGGNTVRWVLHGTPASGAGVIGCLEMGCSVVCLCEDAHHKGNFQIALKERAVERLITGSRVFKDPGLSARAVDLLPGANKEDKDLDGSQGKEGGQGKEEESKKGSKKEKKEAKGKKGHAKGGMKKKSTKKETKEKKDGEAKTDKKRKKDECSSEEDDEEDGEASSEEDDDDASTMHY